MIIEVSPGYIAAICILSFAFGICVSLLAYNIYQKIKEQKNEKNTKRNDP